MKKNNRMLYVSQSAVIAALYVVLTYVSAMFGLSSGAIQCRLSEALCVLPVFTPAGVPGLFIGCLLSNILTGCVLPDVIFGSIATLIGAIGTMLLFENGSPKYTYVIPPILANTVIIPFVLKYAYGIEEGIAYFAVTVFAGEVISCGILGMFLYFWLTKHEKTIFKI